MGDVAPILVRNCIACHNPKKSESKYVMTTFHAACQGWQAGRGYHACPGKPDDSYFLDVLQPDAEPRMPYKLDPLPQDKIKLLERWVAEGARYDGTSPTEDWTFLLRKTRTVTIPEAYPVTVPITALAFSPDGQQIAASGYHEITFWKTADGVLDHRVAGLSERTYGIVYSGDGQWLATASGDPGQYGLVRLWSAGEGRRQAGPRPRREPGRRLRRRLQPRRQAAGHRRCRPDHPGLRDRDRQAAGADRGPRRLDLRYRLQPRRQSPRHAPAATRRARCSTW